jgi:hypothetical protein
MIAHAFQVFFSQPVIVCLTGFSVVGSIHFDDESVVARHKIYDIVANDVLSQKLDSSHFFPQMFPQDRFRQCRVLSVLTGKGLQQSISVR